MKSLLHVIFILHLIGFSGNLLGQSKQLYLYDSLTKVPIEFVNVQNETLTFNKSSDENGFVNLSKWPQESTFIRIGCIGYESKKIVFESLKFEKNVEKIYLKSKISSLEEVTIKPASNNGLFNAISDFDIHLRPITNSQEVLRMVPGLFIGQHAGGGKAEQIFLRGFDLDHGTDINISVDGMPVNMVSHAHGQGYADLHFVIPEMIDKVNFNKGPYFADKGNFTTAGFVEFKTKDYLDKNFIKVEGGQFNTYRAVTAVNLLPKKIQNQHLFFAGESSFTKGYFDSPQNFSRYNGTLKYHGKLNTKNSFTLTATAFASQWNASGQIPDRAVASGLVGFFGAIDNTEGGHTSRYNLNGEWLTNFSNGGLLRNQLYYSNYAFELYSNFTFFKEDSINGDQIRQKEHRNIIGYNSIFQQEFNVGKIKTETKAGIQIRADDINNIELSRTKNRTLVTKHLQLGNVNELNAGIFYTQKFIFSNQLDITTAIRYDFFSNQYDDLLAQHLSKTTAGIVSPKLNINFHVNERVHLYLYNGRGFHSNDTRVAVQENGKKVLPPAYGTDLGAIFKFGKKWVVQAACWYLWLDQEFIYVGDEGVVEAGGKTQRMGADVSIRYQISRNIYADLDANIAQPKALHVPIAESNLPLAPKLTSIGGISYRKQKGLNGSLRYRFMGDRPANETNTVVAKGYFVVDFALNYTQKRYEIGLSIQNLLNTKWKETQFDTESKLQNEVAPVSEIHFTPGTPFFLRLQFRIFF
jgi:outer membrane cobalamin receptor